MPLWTNQPDEADETKPTRAELRRKPPHAPSARHLTKAQLERYRRKVKRAMAAESQ